MNENRKKTKKDAYSEYRYTNWMTRTFKKKLNKLFTDNIPLLVELNNDTYLHILFNFNLIKLSISFVLILYSNAYAKSSSKRWRSVTLSYS